jgi:Leucine-rich repeat (LRR) protein
MKAIGKNIHGEILEFETDAQGRLFCVGKELVELELPEGIEKVYCYNNQLTIMNVPNSLQYLSCHHNKLTDLVLPRTMHKIWCDSDSIKNLSELQSSMIKILYFT